MRVESSTVVGRQEGPCRGQVGRAGVSRHSVGSECSAGTCVGNPGRREWEAGEVRGRPERNPVCVAVEEVGKVVPAGSSAGAWWLEGGGAESGSVAAAGGSPVGGVWAGRNARPHTRVVRVANRQTASPETRAAAAAAMPRNGSAAVVPAQTLFNYLNEVCPV